MCTVSWLHDGDGYELFFNRDERTTRKPALPPAARELEGVRCLMPADGDFGGTWIAVNERGVAVALVNRYQDALPARGGPTVSRGHLMLALAASRSIADVSSRVVTTNLERYEPFTLVALAPGQPALVVDWNGRSRSLAYDGEGRVPLVSSGVDPAGVAAYRSRLLAEMRGPDGRLTPAVLAEFHRSHEPERGSVSPCMHRDDAATVSYSRVRVGPDEVAFEYTPSAPCDGAEPVALRVPRRR